MSCYNEMCLNPTTGTAPQLFSSALQFFAAAQCLIPVDSPPDSEVCDYEEFDYIIVGAGTAGCVVANRLTEDKCRTVLLIEAGGSSPVESRVPALDKYIYGSKYDWGYLGTNDSRISQAFKNGSIIWPRGKMMGGCSNINNMLYVKGVKADYDTWCEAGNKEWCFDIVEKYFKKFESYQYMELLKNPQVYAEYGKHGLLRINRFNSTIRPLTENILDSWNELGIKRVVDINIPGVARSGIVAATAASGVRSSADNAYINSIRDRRNLKIRKNTLVTKILLDKHKKAIGVEAEHAGRKMQFYAKLEVILSAGTVNSPQLLMLSGIGPKKHLNSKNIHCEVDSPMVGQNLQDHILIPITIFGKDGPAGPDAAALDFAAIEYLYNRSGYLAQNSISDVLAFFVAPNNSHLKQPQYQSHFNYNPKNTAVVYSTYADLFRFREPIPTCVAELNKNHTFFTFQFDLLHPKSRGNISLNSNNPTDHPLIFPNYFSNPDDLDSAVTGIRTLTKIIYTKFFKSINAFLGRLCWPPCDKFEVDSIDYWKCICINLVLSIFHPVGTCKMGPDPDTSVVDSRLRVYGVRNLRVIDASIMPNITSGNINGPTNMIGERGADLVKEDHPCSC